MRDESGKNVPGASQDEKTCETIVDATRNADLSTAQGKTHTLAPSAGTRRLRLVVTHGSADPCAHVQEIRIKTAN